MNPRMLNRLADAPQDAPKSQIRQANEALILAAAERVFAGAGFGGATMAAIAEAAGLPKANLHYYFGSKQALCRTVLGCTELSEQDHAKATEHVVSLILRGYGL